MPPLELISKRISLPGSGRKLNFIILGGHDNGRFNWEWDTKIQIGLNVMYIITYWSAELVFVSVASLKLAFVGEHKCCLCSPDLDNISVLNCSTWNWRASSLLPPTPHGPPGLPLSDCTPTHEGTGPVSTGGKEMTTALFSFVWGLQTQLRPWLCTAAMLHSPSLEWQRGWMQSAESVWGGGVPYQFPKGSLAPVISTE